MESPSVIGVFFLAGMHGGGGGRLLTQSPPSLPALRAHLVAKGQLVPAIHMVAPKAPECFFFIPLAHVAPARLD